jgi:hypothetical protein
MVNAAKKSTARPIVTYGLWRTLAFLVGPGRTFTLAVLLVAGFTGGTWAVWRRVEKHVENSPDYLVKIEQITITPPPEWVRSDVRAEAFHNATSPDRPLSLLDDNLAERIHIAFMLHPWVAKATVTKSAGARVRVDIEYRRPACMVEVAAGQLVELLPVDGQGVWLPGEDFSQKQKEGYPCLAGIDRRPIQPVGHAWGDPRVIDGAAVAAVLQPVWQQLKLYRIQCVPLAAGARPMFELYTRGGTKIIWGAAGGSILHEPGNDEKVARLQQYAAAHGGLVGTLPLDVRTLPAAKVATL